MRFICLHLRVSGVPLPSLLMSLSLKAFSCSECLLAGCPALSEGSRVPGQSKGKEEVMAVLSNCRAWNSFPPAILDWELSWLLRPLRLAQHK